MCSNNSLMSQTHTTKKGLLHAIHQFVPNPLGNNTNMYWLCRKGIIAYICFDFKDS